MDFLLGRMANEPRLRSLVEGITNLQDKDVIDSLVLEFVRVAERYKTLSDFAKEIQKDNAPIQPDPPAVPSPKPLTKKRETLDDSAEPSFLKLMPLHIELPRIDMSAIERRVEQRLIEDERRTNLLKELDTIEQLINIEVKREWDNKATEIRDTIVRLKQSEKALQEELLILGRKELVQDEAIVTADEASLSGTELIGDDDLLFIYAASKASEPIKSEVVNSISSMKGVDEKNTLFIVEREGVRFVVSKIQQDSIAVTKSGVLLTGKAESIRLRQSYESVLNTLRCHMEILPYEFGSLVYGREAFEQKIGPIADTALTTLAAETPNATWKVNIYALESRITELLPRPAKKRSERTREPFTNANRMDFKHHEKLLQTERLFAEAIHAGLSASARNASIEMMVGSGSGRSDDWKPILCATYELSADGRQKFFTTLTQLQLEYNTKGLMLEVHGTVDRVSLADL